MTSRRALPGLQFVALVAVVSGLGLLAWLLLAPGGRSGEVALAAGSPDLERAAALAAVERAGAAGETHPGDEKQGEAERSSEEIVPPPPPPAEVPAGAMMRILGKVVDERRYPIADADVTLWLPDRPKADLKSDAQGKFEFTTAKRTTPGSTIGGVHARDGRGRAALATVWIWTNANDDDSGNDWNQSDLGALVLGPAGRVVADVRDEEGAVADVPLVMEVGEERRVALTATTSGSGRAEFDAVPAGDFIVHASLAGRGAARATGRVEAGGRSDVSLKLAAVAPIEVTVKTKGSGAPVAGAHVSLLENVPASWGEGSYKEKGNTQRESWQAFPPTDADGITRLADVDADGRYMVAVRAQGGLQNSWEDGCPSQVELRGTRQVTLWLVKPDAKTFRFPAVEGSAPVPAAGTKLKILHLQREWGEPGGGNLEATVDGDAVVVESPWQWGFYGWAVAPDGSLAELSTQWRDDRVAVGRNATFEKPRKIDLTLKDPAGKPCAQHRIRLALTSPNGGGQREFNRRADEEGHAGFDQLLPGRADLHAAIDKDGWPEYALGVLDLSKGDGKLDVTLPTLREIVLRVRVDSEPRLPAKFQVHAERLVRSRTIEDPASGVVRLFALEDGAGRLRTLNFSAEEFPPQNLPVPEAQGDQPTELEVELTTGGALQVRVVATPQNYPRLKLERYDAQLDAFGDFPGMPGWIGSPNGPDGSYLFTSLAPGTYRASDRRFGVTSDAVEVFGGGRQSEVELDLKHVVTVTGKVVGPRGFVLNWARVLVVDGTQPLEPVAKNGNVSTPGYGVGRDGAFRVVLPLKQATRLRVWHPWLQPAQQGGEVAIDDSVDGIELKLEESAVVSFTPVADPPLGDGTSMRVWLSDVARRDQVAAVRMAVVMGGVARFGQTPSGLFDLLVDAGRGAPVFLRGVELDAAGGDLGRIVVPRGSQLSVELEVPDGVEKPKVRAWARRLGAINYGRGSNDVSIAPVVAGLGAGRFECNLYRESGELGWRGEIDVDGVNDVFLHAPMR